MSKCIEGNCLAASLITIILFEEDHDQKCNCKINTAGQHEEHPKVALEQQANKKSADHCPERKTNGRISKGVTDLFLLPK